MLIRLLIAITLFAAGAARADASEWYVIVEPGQSRNASAMNRGANDAELAAAGYTAIGSHEDIGYTSLAFGGGYRLSKSLAIEATYFDIGELRYYSARFMDGVNVGAEVRRWDASAFGLALVWNRRLTENVGVMLKAAAYRASGDFFYQRTTRDPVTQALVTFDERRGSGSEIVPGIAAGLTFALGGPLDARVVYERWANRGGLFGAGNDLTEIQYLSLGFTYTLP
jgi:hypothetical protein